MNIGDKIKAIRESLGLTQTEFAELFNRSRPKNITTTRIDVSKYENNYTTPPGDKYHKFLTLQR